MIHFDFLKDLEQSLIREPITVSEPTPTLEDLEHAARYSDQTLTQEALLRELAREPAPIPEGLLRDLVREPAPIPEGLLRELAREPAPIPEGLLRELAREPRPAFALENIEHMAAWSNPTLDTARLLAESVVKSMATISAPVLDTMNELTRAVVARMERLDLELTTMYQNSALRTGGAIPWEWARKMPDVSYTPFRVLPPAGTSYAPSPSQPTYGTIGPFHGRMSEIRRVKAFMQTQGIPPDAPIWQGLTLEQVLAFAEAREPFAALGISIVLMAPQQRGRRTEEEYEWAFPLVAAGTSERKAFHMMIEQYNITISNADDNEDRFAAFRQAMKRLKGKYRI